MLRDPLRGLVDDVTTWRDAAGVEARVCTTCLWDLLEGRAVYLEGSELTRWRSGDVAKLVDLAIERLTGSCDLSGHGMATLSAYLRFLDESGRLHPASASAASLRRQAARVGDRYAAGMADRSRFALAKTVYTGMRDDGVDVNDDAAVDAWTAAFSERPEHERVALLGHHARRQPDLAQAEFIAWRGKVAALEPGQAHEAGSVVLGGLTPGAGSGWGSPLPAVTLPSRAELAAAARQATLFRRVMALAAWVGVGRAVARRESLVPADVTALARHLDLSGPDLAARSLVDAPIMGRLLRLAARVELLRLGTAGWGAGPALPAQRDLDVLDDDTVLDLWRDVFGVIIRGNAGREAMPDGKLAPASSNEIVGACVPGLLMALYRAPVPGDAAFEVSSQVEQVVSDHLTALAAREGRVVGKDAAVQPSMVVCAALEELLHLGAITLTGPGVVTLHSAIETAVARRGEWGAFMGPMLMAGIQDLYVTLTPLGCWAVQEGLDVDDATRATRRQAPRPFHRAAGRPRAVGSRRRR